MKAGELRHRVTIQQPGSTVDDAGQPVGFEDVATVWARVYDAGGKESVNDDRTVDVRTVRVVLRYRPGILGKMRVLFGDRILEIQQVLQTDGKHVMHELICFEVANG